MSLSPDESEPASRQVANAIRAEIQSGELGAGAKLLSVRKLAEKYNVAPMTAQSAVEILRAENLVYTSPGRGSFVRAEAAEAPREPQGSAEFVTITKHLRQLEKTVEGLTERLAALEEKVSDRRGASRRSR
ncbi:GntR family transcriptional regulator [Streptacidiphilus monticola]|uniref:GntR family transcriptional regulator n=1 Tax=Streptacidiphilus monticola TaxID=2161674 RepID=A0ABW1G5L8_9ACTN